MEAKLFIISKQLVKFHSVLGFCDTDRTNDRTLAGAGARAENAVQTSGIIGSLTPEKGSYHGQKFFACIRLYEALKNCIYIDFLGFCARCFLPPLDALAAEAEVEVEVEVEVGGERTSNVNSWQEWKVEQNK